MRKNKDSTTRSEPSSKLAASTKKSTKGPYNTLNDQEAKISLPEELLSQMENEMKNWKVFHHSHDQDETVQGREPSLRSSIRDESVDNMLCEDSVIVHSPSKSSGSKAKATTPKSKIGLFQGFPLDFREESIENSNLHPNFGISDSFSKRNSSLLNKTSPVSKKDESQTSPNRMSVGSDAATEINGIVKDPIPLFEGRPYLVMSVQNDLPKSRGSQGLFSSPVRENETKAAENHGEIIQSTNYSEKIHFGIDPCIDSQGYVQNIHDLNAFLQDQLIISSENERPRYREITSAAKEALEIFENQGFDYPIGQRGDLITRAARRNLEDQHILKAHELHMQSQLLKKRLSVIFSTGKSMDMSTDSRESLDEPKGITEMPGHDNKEKSVEKEKESIVLNEGSFYHAETESEFKFNDPKRLALYKEPEIDQKEMFGSKVNTSMNLEEEEEENRFVSLIENLLTQNKENKQLGEGLMRLSEIYHEEIGKYEAREKALREKLKKYKENNISLVEVIKNWEKEMEQLATTNKSLHDLVLGLEGELFQTRKKEIELREAYAKQKTKISKLKERSKKDSSDFEEMKKQLKARENKLNTIITNTQGYESLMKTVNVNIKALVKEKNSNKLSHEQIFKVLESVENKTSKFMKELTAAAQNSPLSSGALGSAFRDKLNVYLTEETINPFGDSLTKSYRHPSPGELNSASSRGLTELKKYESVPVSNRSGTQKSPLKRILTNPYTSQITSKKSASPLYKSALTPKDKPANTPSYFAKKSITQRPASSVEKKHHPSLSYRAGDDRGRATEEEEDAPQPKKSKSRERSAPETKNRGNTKEIKRGSQC